LLSHLLVRGESCDRAPKVGELSSSRSAFVLEGIEELHHLARLERDVVALQSHQREQKIDYAPSSTDCSALDSSDVTQCIHEVERLTSNSPIRIECQILVQRQ